MSRETYSRSGCAGLKLTRYGWKKDEEEIHSKGTGSSLWLENDPLLILSSYLS